VDPIVQVEAYLESLVNRPAAELNRAQRSLRFFVKLVRHASHELSSNDAWEMAAALTYRTIFGLVPLLMVSMLAFRMFGDMEQAALKLQRAAYAFFNYQVDPARPEALAFKEVLDEKVLDVVRAVSSLNFETIGVIGALLLIWAALGLLISFENAANRIYRAPSGRGWLPRVGIYWTVLTLGPILLVTVLYAAEFWLGRAEALPGVGPVFGLLGSFGSVAGSFLALVLLYKLMPNTHVRWQPALLGALVAALLWDLSKWGFGLYVSRGLPYLKVYGAIGLIPLFLFWVYLSWLINLFGLQIAFALQSMRKGVFESTHARGALKTADPQWIVPLAAAIARGARDGEPVSRQKLAEDLDLRLESVAELVEALEKEGLVLHSTRPGSPDVGLLLALPAERVPLTRLIEIASRLTRGETPREGPGWGTLAWLHEATTRAAAGRTVADLLAAEAPSPSPVTTRSSG
jgi:membrane protein